MILALEKAAGRTVELLAEERVMHRIKKHRLHELKSAGEEEERGVRAKKGSGHTSLYECCRAAPSMTLGGRMACQQQPLTSGAC